jgi:hypothetical protein
MRMEPQDNKKRKDVQMLLSWVKAGVGLNMLGIAAGMLATGLGGLAFVSGRAASLLVKSPSVASTLTSVSSVGLLGASAGLALSSGILRDEGGIKALFNRFSDARKNLANGDRQGAIFALLQPTDKAKKRSVPMPEPPPPRKDERPPPVSVDEPIQPAKNVRYITQVKGLRQVINRIDPELFAQVVRNSRTLKRQSDNRVMWGDGRQQYGEMTIARDLVLFTFTNQSWRQVPPPTKDKVAIVITSRVMSVSISQPDPITKKRGRVAWDSLRNGDLTKTPELYSYVQEFAEGGGVAV